jgi:hypothetical protein
MRAAVRGQIVRDSCRNYFVDPDRLQEIGERCERKVFELFASDNPTRKQEDFARFEARRTRFNLAIGLHNHTVAALSLRELDKRLCSGQSIDEAIDFMASHLRDHTAFGHLIKETGPAPVPNDELLHLLSIVTLYGHDVFWQQSRAGGTYAALYEESQRVRNLDSTTLRLWHKQVSRDLDEHAGGYDLTLSAFVEEMTSSGPVALASSALEQAGVGAAMVTLFFFKWYSLCRDTVLDRLDESRTVFETNSWLVRAELVDLETPLLQEIDKPDQDIRIMWRAAQRFFEKAPPQVVGRCLATHIKHATDRRIDPVYNLLRLGASVFFPTIAQLYDNWFAQHRQAPPNACPRREHYTRFVVGSGGVTSRCIRQG